MRPIVLVLACTAACARPIASPTSGSGRGSGSGETKSSAPLEVSDASAPALVTEALAPPPAPAPRPPPRVILHAGDSMVGGNGGLARALDAKFKPFGTRYVRDWRVATVQTFDYKNYFGKLLDANHPDMVIINLGANDAFVPNPKSLARFVASIARKASSDGRICYWITPPLWKPPDTGIVAVIKEHAIGCKVFDSSDLVLPKWPDGIHPSNVGGAIWAEKFWAFYQEDCVKPDFALPAGLQAGTHSL